MQCDRICIFDGAINDMIFKGMYKKIIDHESIIQKEKQKLKNLRLLHLTAVSKALKILKNLRNSRPNSCYFSKPNQYLLDLQIYGEMLYSNLTFIR